MMNDLRIMIDDETEGIRLSVNLMDLSLSIKSDSELVITVDESEYQNIYLVKFLLDDVLDIVGSKMVQADLSLKYKNLTISGLAKVDFNNSLALSSASSLASSSLFLI